MSGHSKWSTIKHKKGAADAKRGNIFTKISKMLTIAAREKGADPVMNVRLRVALDKARAANMPNDNIERAIKKGTGELEGVTYEEGLYEAFGPAGAALIIEAVTDNKNRTIQEIKLILSKGGGNFGGPNTVLWMFDRVGIITINKEAVNVEADEAELLFIDAGAQDIEVTKEGYLLQVKFEDLFNVVDVLEKQNIKVSDSALVYVAKDEISLSESEQEKLDVLIEKLNEHDDVQAVYTNVG